MEPARVTGVDRARIVTVVGLSGTGKSTVVERLATSFGRGLQVVYFGGLVVDEVRRRGLPVTEDNEHTVRTELRSEHGMAAMAVLSAPRIRPELKRDRSVVVDGLYSQAELDYLRERFPERVHVIAVHTDRQLRIERLATRSERPLSGAQMDERDRREIRTLDKAPPIVTADHHILNNHTKSDLNRAIDSLIANEGWAAVS